MQFEEKSGVQFIKNNKVETNNSFDIKVDKLVNMRRLNQSYDIKQNNE